MPHATNQPLRATIDRIVSDQAGQNRAVLVFDDGQQLVVPAELLPRGARPQQVLLIRLQIDMEETSRRAGEVARIQGELFG
jgi:hypothetical protein